MRMYSIMDERMRMYSIMDEWMRMYSIVDEWMAAIFTAECRLKFYGWINIWTSMDEWMNGLDEIPRFWMSSGSIVSLSLSLAFPISLSLFPNVYVGFYTTELYAIIINNNIFYKSINICFSSYDNDYDNILKAFS